jgi:hypothetical protein
MQVAERVDRDVDLRAFSTLGPIPPGAVATLRAGLQRGAFEDHGCGPVLAASEITQKQTQIVHHPQTRRL